VAGYGADVDGFDFPLKNSLKDLCNGNGSGYNMAWLNHAGLVRNNSGNSLPGNSVVTFVDNHDTGKSMISGYRKIIKWLMHIQLLMKETVHILSTLLCRNTA